MQQSITLISAIVLGLLFPQISFFSFLLAPILGTMLFFTFLKNHLPWKIFTEWRVYALFFLNIGMGFLAYGIGKIFFNHQIAFILFLVGITPTALAAPAIMSILKQKVEFGIASVFLTNFGITLLFPFFVSFVSPVDFSTQSMLIKIFFLLFVPFFLAKTIEKFSPILKKKLLTFPHIAFYLWASIIIISIATISAFVRNHWTEYSDLLFPTGLSAAILCAFNFTLGHFLGGKNWQEECSQCLGQKNLQIPIWISLTFFSPIDGLGAAFYIVFHNLANSWKLWKFHHSQKSPNPTSFIPKKNIFLCDNDSTFMKEESLDELAKWVSDSAFQKISAFTNQQMNGEEKISFHQSLETRMEMLFEEMKRTKKNITKENVEAMVQQQLSFSAGAEAFLQKMIVKKGTLKGSFFILSGGFFEIIAPKILELDIPKEEQKILQKQIFCNHFLWDKNGNLAAIDWEKSVMWEENAKGKMAKKIVETNTCSPKIIGIGDGSNDLSFRQKNGMFVAFVGNVRREKVVGKADLVIENFLELEKFL